MSALIGSESAGPPGPPSAARRVVDRQLLLPRSLEGVAETSSVRNSGNLVERGPAQVGIYQENAPSVRSAKGEREVNRRKRFAVTSGRLAIITVRIFPLDWAWQCCGQLAKPFDQMGIRFRRCHEAIGPLD
jgi:hypothetical protein